MKNRTKVKSVDRKQKKVSNKLTGTRPTKHSTKETWEQIIKKNEKMIAESWKADNPQKAFSGKIRKLYKNYKNNNKNK